MQWQSNYPQLHYLMEAFQLHLHLHIQVLEQTTTSSFDLYPVKDALAFVQFCRGLCVLLGEFYLGLEAVLDEHDGDGGLFDGCDDGLFEVVLLLEVLVGVVVAGGAGGVAGHAVAHVHLLADLGHLDLVDWIVGDLLMKVGSGSRSMAAASSLCTRTSAYLLIGEVKCVQKGAARPQWQNSLASKSALQKQVASFMHLVVMILISLLKNSSSTRCTRFKLSARSREVSYLNSQPSLLMISFKVCRSFILGGACLLRMLRAGKRSQIFSATAMLERSMNSQMRQLVSTISYILTSVALWVSSQSVILTCVEARVKAPLSILFCFSFLAILLRFRIACAMLPWSCESISSCACPQVKALRDRMMVLQYRVVMMLASWSTSQMVEKESLSTSERREHRFSVKSLGNMSVRLSTRQTVVQRFLASMSSAESGRTQQLTSAMCTPICRLPLGRVTQCSASSMSLQPGGSMLTTSSALRSTRQVSSSGGMANCSPCGGRQAQAALLNSLISTLCSSRMVSASARLSPIVPMTLTKWQSGYLAQAGHLSKVTMMRLSLSSEILQVLMQKLQYLLSAGTNSYMSNALPYYYSACIEPVFEEQTGLLWSMLPQQFLACRLQMATTLPVGCRCVLCCRNSINPELPCYPFNSCISLVASQVSSSMAPFANFYFHCSLPSSSIMTTSPNKARLFLSSSLQICLPILKQLFSFMNLPQKYLP